MALRLKPKNEYTRYFVTDSTERQSYSPSWQTLATVREQLERVRTNLDAITGDDVAEVHDENGRVVEAIHPSRVEEMVEIFQAIYHLDRAVPNIGPVWCVGYGYRRNQGFSTWSGHEKHETAEKFVKAWERQEASNTRYQGMASRWEIREGSCSLSHFVPEGVSPADVVKGCFV